MPLLNRSKRVERRRRQERRTYIGTSRRAPSWWIEASEAPPAACWRLHRTRGDTRRKRERIIQISAMKQQEKRMKQKETARPQQIKRKSPGFHYTPGSRPRRPPSSRSPSSSTTANPTPRFFVLGFCLCARRRTNRGANGTRVFYVITDGTQGILTVRPGNSPAGLSTTGLVQPGPARLLLQLGMQHAGRADGHVDH